MLSFRKPQSITVARAQAFTRENVNRFFDILKPELEKIEYRPNRVFNVDETGVTVVQHTPEKVLTLKGTKQVHKLSSAERGSLITVVTCMSSGGNYVPPLLIFPRKNKKDEFGDGAPPGSIIGYSPSGWITIPLFTRWFEHFIKTVHPTADDPVILVFDGHFFHTRNIELIEMARKNHVSLVCLPPHCSDKMQPLDVAFMKPFKAYYSSSIETWMSHHPGRIITHYQVSGLFTEAYEKAATMQVARNGFKVTGILPFNPNIFPDYKYVTAPDLPSAHVPTHSEAPLALDTPGETSQSNKTTTSHISPEDIRPMPCVPEAPPSNRRGIDKLVSGSPYMKELKESLQKRDDREAKKCRKNLNAAFQEPGPSTLKKSKTLKTPKKLNKDPEETQATSSKTSRNGKKPTNSSQMKISNTTTKKGRGRPRKKQQESSDSESDSSTYSVASSGSSLPDADCQFCSRFFSEDTGGEEWLLCSKCFEWCHAECDAVDEECSNKRKFICTMCLAS